MLKVSFYRFGEVILCVGRHFDQRKSGILIFDAHQHAGAYGDDDAIDIRLTCHQPVIIRHVESPRRRRFCGMARPGRPIGKGVVDQIIPPRARDADGPKSSGNGLYRRSNEDLIG